MKKTILAFGLLIAALLILFRLGQYNTFEGNLSTEILVSVIAIVFFFVGLYFRKKNLVNQQVADSHIVDHKKLKELNISPREHEVLIELVNGLSNKEIADKLFVSESTVKTHISNIYAKLEVSRRSQAILRSKELRLVERA